jgi:hypothetical protein
MKFEMACDMAGRFIMTKRLSCAGLALIAGLPFFAQPAAADPQALIVDVDQSKVLSLASTPDTLVIGNPSIADASIQGTNLFLHGRSFGTTNIIALDAKGGELANYELTVQLGGRYNLAVFKAGNEFSFVCAPNCEAQMHVGDQKDWFREGVLERNKDKITLATGQKPSEVNQPEPAQ